MYKITYQTLALMAVLILPLNLFAQSSSDWWQVYREDRYHNDLMFQLDSLGNTIKTNQLNQVPSVPIRSKEDWDKELGVMQNQQKMFNDLVCRSKAGAGAYYDEGKKSCTCGYGYDYSGKCTARDVYMKRWCSEQYGPGSFYSYPTDKCECRTGYFATKNGNKYQCVLSVTSTTIATTTKANVDVDSLKQKILELQTLIKKLQAERTTGQ